MNSSKKIETINNDGTISEIEVNFDIWKFDKDDFWKQDWQERKSNKGNSFEEMIRLNEEVYKGKLPTQFSSVSAENEYIKIYENSEQKPLIKKLYKAIDQLSKKQRRIIILRFSQDMTISRIAKIEKCTERAIYLNISSALNSLNEILNEKND